MRISDWSSDVCSSDLETTLKALDGVAEGGPLAPLPRALIQLGLAASVTALDREALSIAVAAAYKRGATPGQVQEVIALVSGLGVHSLMISAVVVQIGRAHV